MRSLFFSLAVLVAAVCVPGVARAQCFSQPGCRLVEAPATQTIGSGGTIKDDGCSTVKNVSADGAVTTDTTNTFTAPSGGNKGCIMAVCNVGAQVITLDSNTNFPGSGASNVTLGVADCVLVAQTGTVWYQLSAVLSNN